MHVHIQILVHYARLLGNMRLFGTTLLVLLISLLQLDSTKSVSVLRLAKATHHDRAVSIQGDSSVPGGWRGAGVPAAWKSAEADPFPPVSMNKNAHTSVLNKLEAGIVMVPRMNRTPKPKSVYRSFARAPGSMKLRNTLL